MIEQRASWLVSLADADAEALVCAALRDAGGVPLVLRDQGPAAGAALTGAVVEVTPPDVDGRIEVLRALRERYPDLTIIVVHSREEVAVAWAAVQVGATPWVSSSLSGSRAWSETAAVDLVGQLRAVADISPPMSTEKVRQEVADALIRATTSRPMAAIARLCRLQRSGSTEKALDVLTETSAALIVRLEHRSWHPIPLERIVDRLDVESDADRRRCTALLRSTMNRAAALQAVPGHRTREASPPEQLYVAFHATAALVRFSAARSWTRPERLLLSHLRDHAARQPCVPA